MNSDFSNRIKLFNQIEKLACEIGFADFGVAPLTKLVDEIALYQQSQSEGYFGQMEYLSNNIDKREDPNLLLNGAKSVLVFLAPFSYLSENKDKPDSASSNKRLKISDFALGEDYHLVIKERLNMIANLIDRFVVENNKELDSPISAIIKDRVCLNKITSPNFAKYKSLTCRVFTDSAPILERAWGVRAGIGFIGKNNFLISHKCGIKNFIGIILSTIEIPPSQTVANTKERVKQSDICGKCRLCIDACSQKALFAPHKIDARKCIAYKTIEQPIGSKSGDYNGWIFGCDDCMNACPWNKFNKKGWGEFHKLAYLLRGKNGDLAPGETDVWWDNLSQNEFDDLFKKSPLKRAGLDKIKENIKTNTIDK